MADDASPETAKGTDFAHPPIQRKQSISEQATARSTRRIQPPAFLKWLEIPFRTKNSRTGQYLEEATGHAMDVAARGPINQTGSFIGSAIIRLATIDAGCLNPVQCDSTVYGIKPSSVLTMGNLVVGILAGVTMPFMGALVDHSNHRKVMGAISAFITVVSVAVQLMISLDTWFIVYIFECIGGYFLIMHQVCTMAYLPDLTHDESEMSHYTARFMMSQYAVQGVYTSIVIGLSFGLNLTNIQTSQTAAGLGTGFGVIFFGYAWTFLFRKRPALREIPPGGNIFTTGFKQLAVTTKVVFKNHKALKWFMIALLFSPEAGAGTILAIAVTFLTIFVRMDVKEIAIVSLVMLFCNIPGAMLSKIMCKKVNPLNSFRMAEILFGIVNGLIALTVTGPERKKIVYFYSGLAGLAFGWMFPSQRTLAVALIPKGQETEIMGLISFFGQVVGWLPAFVFTTMNENNISMRWGLGSISFFLFTSCAFTFLCGDYNEACALVANSSDEYCRRFSQKDGSFMDEEAASAAKAAAVAQAPVDTLAGVEEEEEVELTNGTGVDA